MALLFAALLAVVSTSADAGLFGYSSYYDCILDQMPGVKNDIAASAVMRSCNEKAPNRDVETKRLTFFGMNRIECIKKRAKDVGSERGAIQVRLACNNLYDD